MFNCGDFEELVNLIKETQEGDLSISPGIQQGTFIIKGESSIVDNKLGRENIVDIDFREPNILKVRTISFIEKRKGTGTNVIKWLENFALEKEISQILIGGVGKDNVKAVSFYKKCGFYICNTNKESYRFCKTIAKS